MLLNEPFILESSVKILVIISRAENPVSAWGFINRCRKISNWCFRMPAFSVHLTAETVLMDIVLKEKNIFEYILVLWRDYRCESFIYIFIFLQNSFKIWANYRRHGLQKVSEKTPCKREKQLWRGKKKSWTCCLNVQPN